jgi:hypothetical protein
MSNVIVDYNKVLEDTRHIYKQKYQIVPDDELLMIIIRINELQTGLNRKVDTLPKITFTTGRDYFFFSLGKSIQFLFIGVGLILLAGFFFLTSDYNKKKTYDVSDYETVKVIKLNRYNGESDTILRLSVPVVRSDKKKKN